jgi:hypothetical protein
MALLEKLLSPGTAKTVKTEEFLPATRQPAIAELFSPGLIEKWAFQAGCRTKTGPELNPSFTNVAGEAGADRRRQVPEPGRHRVPVAKCGYTSLGISQIGFQRRGARAKEQAPAG